MELNLKTWRTNSKTTWSYLEKEKHPFLTSLLREVFISFDLGRERVCCSRSYEKFTFYHSSRWPELTSAVSHPHHWMYTDEHYSHNLWLSGRACWPLCCSNTYTERGNCIIELLWRETRILLSLSWICRWTMPYCSIDLTTWTPPPKA